MFDQSLTEYSFQPEGGRAVWYFIDYLLIYNYVINDLDWPLGDVNVLSSATKHNAKWIRIHKDQSEYEKELAKFIKQPELVAKFRDYFNANRDQAVSLCQQTDFAKVGNDELKQLLDQMRGYLHKATLPGRIVRMVDLGLVKKLRAKNYSDSDLVLISTTKDPSQALSEKIALLALAVDVRNNHLKLEDAAVLDRLNQISAQYCYSDLGYYDERIKTADDYQQKLSEFVSGTPADELAQLEKDRMIILAQREKFVQQLDEEGHLLAELASDMAAIKDEYKLAMNKILYFFEPLFVEIAKRADKPLAYIKDLAPEEIKDVLDHRVIDETMITRRFENRVLLAFKKKFYVLIGAEAAEFKQKYLEVDQAQDKLTGRCASRGHAVGMVKVVLSLEDFSKLKSGDILVVMNTSPDFTPIIKLAGAIIAEEGGLTAHVSIVSREMKVPAVVGVHHATEILHDGDEVEVDADRGVVKILSSK
jgi:phosphohistidine swiveling domain-containing protein